MKTIAATLALTALIALLCSCNDIAGYRNVTTENSKQVNSLTKDDSLSYLELHDINFDSVHIHRIPYLYVTFKNNSDTFTINIYNVKLRNDYGFKLYPECGFPVIISPKQSNSNNRFVAEWDTDVVTVGSFQDTIFLNGSEKYPIYILGKVYNR